MKVAIVNFYKGGMEHYAVQVANAHSWAGLHVLLLNRENMDKSLLAQDVSCYGYEFVQTFSAKGMLFGLINLMRLCKDIFRSAPDVVHINSGHPYLLVLLPLLRLRFPVVITRHEVSPRWPGHTFGKRVRLDNWLAAKLANEIVVTTKANESWLVRHYGAQPGNITVVPHGDYGFLAALGDKRLSEEPRTALFFGRIDESKGLRSFVEAALLLQNRCPDCRFIIAGSGDLSEYISPHFNDIFEVHNRFLKEAEIANLFRRARVVVLPYRSVSSSGVLAIAFAFQKIVIASDISGFSQIVCHGKTGLVFPVGDSDALARLIADVFQNPNRYVGIGKNAYSWMCEAMDWASISRTLQDIYKSARR